jgi:hypothetical protein
MYECDKNQMPYCNVIFFKKSIFWEFWAMFYFIIFTFINEKINKIKNFKVYTKFGTKVVSFDMKKKVKCKTSHEKKKKKNLGVLRVSP